MPRQSWGAIYTNKSRYIGSLPLPGYHLNVSMSSPFNITTSISLSKEDELFVDLIIEGREM